jgi:hypothetical protein
LLVRFRGYLSIPCLDEALCYIDKSMCTSHGISCSVFKEQVLYTSWQKYCRPMSDFYILAHLCGFCLLLICVRFYHPCQYVLCCQLNKNITRRQKKQTALFKSILIRRFINAIFELLTHLFYDFRTILITFSPADAWWGKVLHRELRASW